MPSAGTRGSRACPPGPRRRARRPPGSAPRGRGARRRSGAPPCPRRAACRHRPRCRSRAIPAPPARIASANVPWGTRVASISPVFTAATASGFEVKYDEIPRRIRPCRSSLPSPRPGSPMLFETIVRSVASEWSTSASISVERRPDQAEAAHHHGVARPDVGDRLLRRDHRARRHTRLIAGLPRP